MFVCECVCVLFARMSQLGVRSKYRRSGVVDAVVRACVCICVSVCGVCVYVCICVYMCVGYCF